MRFGFVDRLQEFYIATAIYLKMSLLKFHNLLG